MLVAKKIAFALTAAAGLAGLAQTAAGEPRRGERGDYDRITAESRYGQAA